MYIVCCITLVVYSLTITVHLEFAEESERNIIKLFNVLSKIIAFISGILECISLHQFDSNSACSKVSLLFTFSVIIISFNHLHFYQLIYIFAKSSIGPNPVQNVPKAFSVVKSKLIHSPPTIGRSKTRAEVLVS